MDVGKVALVTGGGGFLGKAIVEQLLRQGVKVRSFGRGKYPELEKMGAEVISGDISTETEVRAAAKGCDIVYHVAARPGAWGPYAEFHRVNVTGTECVIAACRAEKINRLVYTSSPSVVFDGKDMEGPDERVPYPDHYEAHYPKTKALAEQTVLKANCPELCTVALRPHLIWGPGDRHLAPRLIARARSGQLKIIGSGKNLIDTVFIDNAAEAHLLAAERLQWGSPVAGRAYFITNGDPRPTFEMINGIIGAAGCPPCTSTVPVPVAYAMGALFELWHRITGNENEPRITRWVANELATAHWFNIDAAKRDLGYNPKVSIDEGFKRLAAWFKDHPPQEPPKA